METEILKFWTEGKYLTKILRTFWEERNCIHAFMSTKKGLGMDEKQSLDLFEGRMKLTGDTRNNPNLYLEEDNDYNGISIEDMIDWFEKRYIRLRIDKLDYDLSLRNNMIKYLHYGDGERIGATEEEAKNAALYMEKKTFEYLRNLLFLYNVAGKSVLDFENKVLKAMVDADTGKVYRETKAERNAQLIQEVEMEAIKKILPGAPTTVDEYIDNENKIDEIRAINGKPEDSQSGWLSPQGDFYPCPYAGHAAMMVELAESKIVENVTDEKDLDRQGWAKITSLRVYNGEERFTNKQIDFIFDFAVVHKLDKIQINFASIKQIKIIDHLTVNNI